MICRLIIVIICLLLSVYADDPEQPPTAAGPRIVGGYKVSRREEVPYQVSLRRNGQHFCGATILSKDHVLTAAHCCFDDKNKIFPAKILTVVVGDLNIKKPVSGSTLKKNVKYVFTHSKYNPETIANDIAVLRIKGDFGTWSSVIKPLPVAKLFPRDWTSCKVSGWGALDYQTGITSNNLYAANVNIMDKLTCRRGYGSQIKTGMFCAGHIQGGIDSCQGDSGGPLEYAGTLVGVVSWGYKCAVRNYPGVYTNVTHYLSWISEQESRSSSEITMATTLTVTLAMVFHLARLQ